MLVLRKQVLVKPTQRIHELDVLRGLTVLAMILYHVWLLCAWMGKPFLSEMSTIAPKIALIIPTSFLIFAGMSLQLVTSRNKPDGLAIFIFRRFLTLGVASLLVTMVTAVLVPQLTIYFGILHLIGVSTLVIGWLLIQGVPNGLLIGLAALTLGIGLVFGDVTSEQWLGIPFGLEPVGFSTLDYFPLFPWISPILVGVLLSRLLYPQGKAHAGSVFDSLAKLPLWWPIRWLGQNSLLVYLVHIPLIWLIITLWGMISTWL